MMLIYFIFLSQNMDASAKFKTALNSVNFFAMWLKQLDDVMTDYKKK